MAKSFYDLDYIIEVNEKRIEQYLAAYQKVLERFTNIILIYSAMTIFLVSIIKTVFLKECPLYMHICFTVFAIPFIISLIYTVRLIIPVEVAYLSSPNKYYESIRLDYEKSFQKAEIENLLKASYITELEKTLINNKKVFQKKSSFYYNALMYSLISAISYIFCIGFHVFKNEESIQKVEVVIPKKISNLLEIDSMSSSKNTTNSSNTNSNNSQTKNSTNTTSRLPGVNNNNVIQSSPDLVKENSYNIKKK